MALFAILILNSTTAADDPEADKMDELMRLASSGNATAQFDLASAYDYGFYGDQDGDLALKYYLMAADQGHAEAQNSVGSGFQAIGNYADALVWYERAAAQKHGLATNNLAYLYDLGLGVEENIPKAFELYSISANLGRADAMWNIANMYAIGQLGEKDLFSACVWTFRALTYINYKIGELQENLKRAKTILRRDFSSEEIQSCEATANEWQPSYDKTNSQE